MPGSQTHLLTTKQELKAAPQQLLGALHEQHEG